MKGVIEQTNIGKAALEYAQNGFKIFPVNVDKNPDYDKSPLCEHGVSDATDNLTQIEAWWKKWPWANIGFGAEHNGRFILDIDIDAKKGLDGYAEIKKLEEKHGALPKTLTSITPRGGRHKHFKMPHDIVIHNVQNGGKLPLGLDVRGHNGYVIVFPSVGSNGQPYQWEDPKAEVVDAPKWLIDLLSPKPKTPIFKVNGYVATSVQDTDGPPIPQGQRDVTLYRIGCALRGKGFEYEEILNRLHDINQKRCIPPMPDHIVEQKAKQAMVWLPNEQELNPSGFKITDKGNAQYFAARNTGGLLYDCKQQRWLLWGGNWWMPDKTGVVLNRAADAARERQAAADQIVDADYKAAYKKWTLSSENLIKLKSCIEIAKAEDGLVDDGENWDANPMLFAVANGVVDLTTGQLRNGIPEDRISQHSNVVYDPTATCPRWLKFLDEIFPGKPDTISYIQRAMGYTLTGSNEEQVMFFCHGVGSNGKNVLIDVMGWMMGNYAGTIDPEALDSNKQSSISNDIAELVGKRLITASETKMTSTLNEQKVKKLVHGDVYSCRKLHQNLFEFTPILKLWFAVNEMPKINDPSNGLWRSTQVVKFEATFVKADEENPNNLPLADKKLKYWLRDNELPGILNWAIQGCLDYQKVGLKPPADITDATKGYREEQDVIAEFLTTCCVVEKEAKEMSSSMYKRYTEWADIQGLKEYEKLNSKSFVGRMVTKFTRKKSDGYYCYFGVRVKDAYEND